MSTGDEIKTTAHLARLAVTESELPELIRHFESILNFFAVLDEVATEDLQEYSHFPDGGNVLREDHVEHTLTTDEALSNAPESSDNFFKTPLIVGSE